VYALLFALVLAVVLLLSGCAFDELTAPAPRALDPLLAPIQGLPTSQLVQVSALQHVPGEGFELDVLVQRGLLTASTSGEADFRLTTRLFAQGLAGQTRAFSPKVDPLVLLKAIGTVGSLEVVRISVPWDGLDGAGAALTGETNVEFRVELGNYRPNPTGDGIVMGAAAGATLVVIAGA
jgi:hypothetical protein